MDPEEKTLELTLVHRQKQQSTLAESLVNEKVEFEGNEGNGADNVAAPTTTSATQSEDEARLWEELQEKKLRRAVLEAEIAKSKSDINFLEERIKVRKNVIAVLQHEVQGCQEFAKVARGRFNDGFHAMQTLSTWKKIRILSINYAPKRSVPMV